MKLHIFFLSIIVPILLRAEPNKYETLSIKKNNYSNLKDYLSHEIAQMPGRYPHLMYLLQGFKSDNFEMSALLSKAKNLIALINIRKKKIDSFDQQFPEEIAEESHDIRDKFICLLIGLVAVSPKLLQVYFEEKKRELQQELDTKRADLAEERRLIEELKRTGDQNREATRTRLQQEAKLQQEERERRLREMSAEERKEFEIQETENRKSQTMKRDSKMLDVLCDELQKKEPKTD